MSAAFSLAPQKTALLLMDFQGFVLKNFVPAAADAVKNAAKLLAAARSANMPAIHVMVSFRPGYPEISPRNRLFWQLRESGLAEPGGDAMAIDAALSPKTQEPVIAKHRIGAFMGTDLDRILRAQGIETLILAGATTSGVVLSTVRQAFDLDYGLIVVRDGCVDAENEVHDFLIDRIIARHAAIVRTEDVTQALEAPE